MAPVTEEGPSVWPAQESFPTLDEAVKIHIGRALKVTGGKIYGKTGAARLLGLKPTTLQSRMKKLGIQP